MGAANLNLPAKRKQAAALVKDGVSISMAVDMDMVKSVDNASPSEHWMLGIGSDYIGVARLEKRDVVLLGSDHPPRRL